MIDFDEPIKVLDKGYVKLVDWMGDDISIVRAARVSYNAKPRYDGSDEKLLKYLLTNGHTSPFESVIFTFEVKAPIFVFRQWRTHRTWSYNEVSARYTEVADEFYIPDLHDICGQSTTNKQGRSESSLGHPELVQSLITHEFESCYKTYETLLSSGVARELARIVLPVATYSKMFATVDLHNLFHFIKLRLHPHAQLEIRVYAEAMLKLIEPIVPLSVKYWKELNNVPT